MLVNNTFQLVVVLIYVMHITKGKDFQWDFNGLAHEFVELFFSVASESITFI